MLANKNLSIFWNLVAIVNFVQSNTNFMALREELVDGIIERNLDTVQNILKKAKERQISVSDILNKDLNKENGWVIPLFRATMQNDFKIVRFLVEEGADIHTRASLPTMQIQDSESTMQYYTALEIAVPDNNIEVVKYLLGKGASLKIQKDALFEQAALHLAADHNNTEIVDLIFQYKGEVDVEDTNGFTPLYYAVKKGHVEIIVKLLNAGASINIVNKEMGYGALHATALKVTNPSLNMEPIIKLLTGKGAEIEKRDENGTTPLRLALLNCNFKAAKALKDNGAEFHWSYFTEKNIKGFTPLFQAIKEGDVDIVKTFFKSGAKVAMSDDYENFTVLHAAAMAQRNVESMIILLLNNGGNLEKEDNLHETPLQYAIKEGLFQAAKIFIKNGASLSASQVLNNSNCVTLMFEAIKEGEMKIIQIVLNAGVDVTMGSGDRNNTVLHAVSYAGRNIEPMITLFKKRSANIERKNDDGETPLQFAIQKHNFEASKVLYKNGAYLDSSFLGKNATGYTPLFQAVKESNLEIVDIFLRKGADVTVGNGDMEYTVLHAAAFARKNIKSLILLLLKNGADLGQKSRDGKTPQMIAIEQKNYETLKVFNIYGIFFNKLYLFILALTSFLLFSIVLFTLLNNLRKTNFRFTKLRKDVPSPTVQPVREDDYYSLIELNTYHIT